MTLDTANLDAIIFDLGDVLLNLDFNLTKIAFGKLGGTSVESVEEIYNTTEFFKEYERGAISDGEFKDEIRKQLKVEASDQEIDSAWNQLLVDIRQQRWHKLIELRGKYQLFLMSNTNAVHWIRILEIWDKLETGKSFYDCFDGVYLSFEIGASKPQKEAWLPIINEQNLNPKRTLFIDDREENILGARSLGLQTYHNVNPDDWVSLF